MSATDENWLRREFARARARSAQLPNFARPVVVRAARSQKGHDDSCEFHAYGTCDCAARAEVTR